MKPLIYISNKEIEIEAEKLLNEFDPKTLQSPQKINIEQILEFLEDKEELLFDYKQLGETEFGETVAGKYYPISHQIFVDQNLFDSSDQIKHRVLRFTEAHEVGHSRIHRKYYYKNPNQLSLFTEDQFEGDKQELITLNRTVEKVDFEDVKNRIKEEKDLARERQANYFSSALLIPKQTLKMLWQAHSLDLPLEIPERYFEEHLDSVSRKFNDFFEVNPVVMKIRIKKLGFIRFENTEGNLMINN